MKCDMQKLHKKCIKCAKNSKSFYKSAMEEFYYYENITSNKSLSWKVVKIQEKAKSAVLVHFGSSNERDILHDTLTIHKKKLCKQNVNKKHD